MNRLIISPQAQEDLIEIHDYIADENPKTAGYFIDLIEEQFTKITRYPEIGVKRPIFGQSIRMIVFQAYLIFYQTRDETVEIVHVYHSKRNISTLFQED